MPGHNQDRAKKNLLIRLKQLFVVGLLVVIVLAGIVYLRPVATIILVQRGLLKLIQIG